MSDLAQIQKELNAEKRRAKVWMIVAIVAMIVGVAMIAVAIIVGIQKKRCKVCPGALELCAVTRSQLENVKGAKGVIKAYDDKLKELVDQGVGLSELEIFGKVRSSNAKGPKSAKGFDPGAYFKNKLVDAKF